jgi:uncharacterized surface protein with fasciclin (FAS1) repeats
MCAISACSASAVEEEAIDLDSVSESSPTTDAMRAAGASTMADVIDALGVDVLGTDEATFFVPSDRAFLTLDADILASMLADDDELAGIVESHTLDRAMSIDDLLAEAPIVLDSGTIVELQTTDDGTISIGGAALADHDLSVDGVTIHVIDGFLTDLTDQRGDQ